MMHGQRNIKLHTISNDSVVDGLSCREGVILKPLNAFRKNAMSCLRLLLSYRTL